MTAPKRGTDAYFWWEQGAEDEARERRIVHPDLKQLAALIEVLDGAQDRWPDPMDFIRKACFTDHVQPFVGDEGLVLAEDWMNR